MKGCSVDSFKLKLDRYLMAVPDEPQIQGYTAIRRAESNSLLDMIKLAKKPGDKASPTTTGVINDICHG